MAESSEILARASAYVTELLTTRSAPWAVYHSLDHTIETVEATRKIGAEMDLSKSDMEIALLAAWLHDTGYVDNAEGHEERSAERAREFLHEEGYALENIERVTGCINATRIPQSPVTPVEQVVCDADMYHLGKKKFFRRSDLLRLEIEQRTGSIYSEEEWLNYTIGFVSGHRFHTSYAIEELEDRRLSNILVLQERLRQVLESKEEKEANGQRRDRKRARKAEKDRRPERGIETMFRTVPKNHLDLSAMADNKANIMISTNSIIISIVFGLLVSKLDTNPHLILPTLLLLAVCLSAMIFGILATRPNVTRGTFTREDIRRRDTNLLFFGNFHGSSYEDFEWGMKEMMGDREYLYGSMIRDIYSLGKVLGKKYRYLRLCYTIFMYGLVAVVVAFVVAFIGGGLGYPADRF